MWQMIALVKQRNEKFQTDSSADTASDEGAKVLVSLEGIKFCVKGYSIFYEKECKEVECEKAYVLAVACSRQTAMERWLSLRFALSCGKLSDDESTFSFVQFLYLSDQVFRSILYGFQMLAKLTTHYDKAICSEYRIHNADVTLSAHLEWNLDGLLDKIWEYLDLTRIYTKPERNESGL
ncbi:hypothetical protein LINPERHAP2_LOCUS24120 [Linum perenne]